MSLLVAALALLVAALAGAALALLATRGRRRPAPPVPDAPGPLGALVVDEVVVPVHRVTLDRGAFVLHCHLAGPAPAVASTHYTVHDAQGAVVYRSARDQTVWWSQLHDRDTLTVSVRAEVLGRAAFRRD